MAAPEDWVGKRVAVYLGGGVRLEAAEGLRPVPSAAIDGELLEVSNRGVVLAAPNTRVLSVTVFYPWHVIQVIQLEPEIEPMLPGEQGPPGL